MKLNNPGARLFVPDAKPQAEALQRITHHGIGAHQDDLEFMAFHGIASCYHSQTDWFGGVTCTNGAGSARTGPYERYTDEEMQAVRRQEQDTAAVVGHYGAMIQLDYTSNAVKQAKKRSLKEDLLEVLVATQPNVVYTHNLADRHETHLAIAIATLEALREMPVNQRPSVVYGCEGWRSLDWLPDADKVLLDVSGMPHLAAAINGVFDSQIAGGKRYDLAVLGRRKANATFLDSHAVDQSEMVSFAMNLTPLVADDTLDIVDYVVAFTAKFEADVRAKLTRQLYRE